MTEIYRDRLAALEQTWQAWATLGTALTDDQWRTPSRCTGWDVAALYAHHSVFPSLMSNPLPQTDAPGEPVTASEVVRGFNARHGTAHTMAETVEDQAVQAAAQHTQQELVDRFAVLGPEAIHQLSQVKPTLVVPWPPSDAVLVVAEALRIVLLEATVHLLDVQRALGHPPTVPASALADTARLLADVAPPVAWIEAATGRSTESPLPVLR